jgi:hypothetical protein
MGMDLFGPCRALRTLCFNIFMFVEKKGHRIYLGATSRYEPSEAEHIKAYAVSGRTRPNGGS